MTTTASDLGQATAVTAVRRPHASREYVALAALLLGTACAYLWNLSANGWGNTFYSAAVQAGSQSWQAFFFGSSDAANTITVDKTPASLWPMEICVRIFGLSSWSIQLPQVLMGVAAVALLWVTVRRSFGPTAGLLAGLALASTPVAALMFRFDNPDALLVLLMVAAVWAMTRALDDGRWRWLVLCGALVGFGFLAKQLQVLLVLPALAATYLIAGPPELGKRVLQLFAAAAAMVAGAGWWLLIAQLWPASSRPWFGGSKHNSIIELTLGYNGLDRIAGSAPSATSDSPWVRMFTSGRGIGRLFDSTVGGQISWLIPAALLLLVAGLVLRGRAARTDPQRAALILFGGWGLVTGLVFSFMSGTFHEYYTVALAPAVAAVVGAGAVMLWREREKRWTRAVLTLCLLATTVTAWVMLSRDAVFLPWLRWVVLSVGVVTALTLSFGASRPATGAAVAAVLVALAGPAAYTADTIANPHTGGIPLAGPTVRDEQARGPEPAGAPSDQVLARLTQNGTDYTWVAAAVSSMKAAEFQLDSGRPVMPIGGFAGGDPAPTLAQFQDDVAQARIHYFIAGKAMGASTDTEGAKITQWVQETFTPTTVDGITLYDLTTPHTAS
ncbi:glycosyltransferase family 39 protein [Nocardia iowensis]|uniref:glycosyltransferase family 39 protein n=1 Tax=Nocardia iowensis TaxID=204891 RepID=UPI0037190ED1